jgi:hypothetical protein
MEFVGIFYDSLTIWSRCDNNTLIQIGFWLWHGVCLSAFVLSLGSTSAGFGGDWGWDENQ